MAMLDLVRLAIAGFAFILLTYWTVRRARGDGDDPVLRMSKSSDTGSTTMLVSGFYAVLAVAGVMTVVLAPEIGANPALGLVPFALVAAHYLVEKGEAA